MEAGTSIEILDLRHFSAPALRPVLEAEGALWRERLHWDYRASAKLLMQYLDNRSLPGYMALDGEQPVGYAFSVCEDTKAVIGEVYALEGERPGSESARAIETKLLRHLLELLTNSPQLERIEAQLLLHPTGIFAGQFLEAGFEVFQRLFMVRSLLGLWSEPKVNLPAGLELSPWREDDLPAAAKLICDSYQDHPDSLINDQYRTVHGSTRFLNNIVRYAGCGAFSAPASHLVIDRARRQPVALVLGSRVSTPSGHITQLCVHPEWRGKGLARMLLSVAAFSFMRQGATELSLTVTEANRPAIALYEEEGYTCGHRFDAAVWQRRRV
jgi:ribosomal protein S18 acetylase RimI-like enzyme